MTTFRLALITIALTFTTHTFAAHMNMSDSKACNTIANTCKKAGYSDGNTGNKRFWQDCMEPAIMSKTVDGVSVDEHVAKSCRMSKIKELKEEMQKLEKVKG